MKKVINANTVEFTTASGEVKKIVVLTSNANAVRYAKGEKVIPVEIYTKKNGKLID